MTNNIEEGAESAWEKFSFVLNLIINGTIALIPANLAIKFL